MHKIIEIEIINKNIQGIINTTIKNKEELLKNLDDGYKIVDKFESLNKIFYILNK